MDALYYIPQSQHTTNLMGEIDYTAEKEGN